MKMTKKLWVCMYWHFIFISSWICTTDAVHKKFLDVFNYLPTKYVAQTVRLDASIGAYRVFFLWILLNKISLWTLIIMWPYWQIFSYSSGLFSTEKERILSCEECLFQYRVASQELNANLVSFSTPLVYLFTFAFLSQVRNFYLFQTI